jgi:alpha-ribazole phosphatase
MTTWIEAGRLLLCRHGQTGFNASLRFQGQMDEPLSDLGRQQAKLLARRLAGEPVGAAYASDLERARETAELALAGRPVPLRLDERLREIAFGRWEGMTFAEIKDKYPDDVAARERDRVHYAIPGGESLQQLGERVRGFLEDVLPQHEGQHLLVIAHGGTVNAILSTLLNIPMTSWWRLRNHNANMSTLNFTPDGVRLASFNDTCHLHDGAHLPWAG